MTYALARALALALALSLPAGAVLAQSGTPGAHFVENWDLDGDGKVTLAEVTEKRGDIFTAFDSNDDGILSAEEYAAFDAARAADRENAGFGQGKGPRNDPAQGMALAANDTNGDGMVSRAEFLATAPAWFKMMDRNGDGVITTQDFGPGN